MPVEPLGAATGAPEPVVNDAPPPPPPPPPLLMAVRILVSRVLIVSVSFGVVPDASVISNLLDGPKHLHQRNAKAIRRVVVVVRDCTGLILIVIQNLHPAQQLRIRQ